MWGSMPDDIKSEDLDATVLQSENQIKGNADSETGAPYLIIVDGPRQGVKFPLIPGDNVVGRVMGSEVLLEDQSVSRRHAIITQSREGWTIDDQGSKNGTFVNGQKISEKVTIGHGDVATIGIYSFRLITKEVSEEEEAKPLPADWEGKTVMTASSQEEDTASMAEKAKEAEKAEEVSESEEASEEVSEEEFSEEEESESGGVTKRGRPRWWNFLILGLLVVVLAGGGLYVYFKFFHKPPKIVEPIKPTVEKSKGPEAYGKVTGPEKPVAPQEIPVFLDFASSPLPASITFQDKEYGQTPIKINVKLNAGNEYSAEAKFDLKEIGHIYKETAKFVVGKDDPLIPILFKGPIGALKIEELPRDTTLYLEAYFIYDPFNAKTAKVEDVVFGKPIYVPYGKYVVELRKPKELAGSGEFVKDIRYKRELLVSEDNPILQIKVTEKDLNEFPVEILSVPANADVFIDANKVGVTPFKGIFPLGEHTLSLRKDGYLEYKQDLKMDMNVPFKTEIEMKTTVAGEFINAGKHLMQKGRYKEAIEKLSDVFKNSATPGETAQTRYLIGSCFVHLNDLSTAEAYFKQALEDEVMKHPSMLGLVSVYHGLGRKNEAVPHLVEVLLNSRDGEIKREAHTLFQQVSPLRSMMYILTDPEGATVKLNDKIIEEKTPVILPDLTLGNYKVRIEKNGYLPQDLSINFSVNEFNPVIVKLRPIPQ
jgi:pSer/pThr/pTyr-binding forkhead associated (FHA) protein/tetratricopeptide (TPR) repeat protein